jgi:dihydrofolate reductase
MGRLIITTAMTLDGVADGFEWYVSEGGHDQASRAQFEEAGVMLLGRKTYEGLAGYWPSQEGPWADRLNPMPKLVASRTLQEPLEWNARLLEGDPADALPRLKAELPGDLMMSGCGELARELLALGLVDELRFWIHPVLWGEGARPFEGASTRLRLLGSDSFDSGVTLLRYEPVQVDAETGAERP